jgi:hypothetical protein
MTPPFDRAAIRALLADQRQRMAVAQSQGRGLACQHDIADENERILWAIASQYGEAGIWRFMHMVEQTKREMDQAPFVVQQRVVITPQLAGPKSNGGQWAVALGVCAIVGLLIGLAR